MIIGLAPSRGEGRHATRHGPSASQGENAEGGRRIPDGRSQEFGRTGRRRVAVLPDPGHRPPGQQRPRPHADHRQGGSPGRVSGARAALGWSLGACVRGGVPGLHPPVPVPGPEAPGPDAGRGVTGVGGLGAPLGGGEPVVRGRALPARTRSVPAFGRPLNPAENLFPLRSRRRAWEPVPWRPGGPRRCELQPGG